MAQPVEHASARGDSDTALGCQYDKSGSGCFDSGRFQSIRNSWWGPKMTHPSLSDSQIKHLEFIQAVINRLANNSFFMKGWALTVAGLIFGFAAEQRSWGIAAAGLLPVVAFWGLDAFFLRQE